jgi:dihydroorotate dehydrogenase
LLLRQLLDARAETGVTIPLLVKIAPDLSPEERADIAAVALATGIEGIVISNTTLARPTELRSPQAKETGGLSGRPLFAPSTALIAEMYRLTEGRVPLIGVGGVASAAGAYTKLRAGASLVQLYTALIFEGPALIGKIKNGLTELLRRDGLASVGEAVGVDAAGGSHG